MSVQKWVETRFQCAEPQLSQFILPIYSDGIDTTCLFKHEWKLDFPSKVVLTGWC